MIQDYVEFFGLPAAIISAPFLSVLFWLMLRRFTNTLYKFVAVLSMAILLAFIAGISFSGSIADELLKCTMYVLLGICAFQICWHRHWVVKTIGVLSCIPLFILPLLVPMYIAAISQSPSSEDEYTTELKDGYQCRVSNYRDRDTSDRGYTTAIYKKLFVFEYKSISSVRIGRNPFLSRLDLCNELFSEFTESASSK